MNSNFIQPYIYLKPCPFCGEVYDISLKIVKENGQPVLQNNEYIWFVECLPCDAATGWYSIDNHNQPNKSGKDLAVDAWNRRKFPDFDQTTCEEIIIYASTIEELINKIKILKIETILSINYDINNHNKIKCTIIHEFKLG